MGIGMEQTRATAEKGLSYSSKRRMGRSQVIILLVALMGSIVAGYAGYQRLAPAPAPAAPVTTNPVRRGTITATVSTVGSMAAISQASLSFESAGRLTELLVKVGDQVAAGTVLAKLDSADLELQVAQAEVALEQARLKLSQLKEGPKELEVAAARANYDSALTKYNDLKASPKPEDVAAAEAAVRDAEAALTDARDNLVLVQKSAAVSKNVRDRENEHSWYERVYGETLAKFNNGERSQADVDKDWSNLMTAKEKLDSARTEADLALRKAENTVVKAEESLVKAKDNLTKLLAGATAEQLKAAEASVLSSQAQLESKSAGTSATDIASQEVAVRLAEATLNQRRLLLRKAPLVAPFDGVVDSISANVGEQVAVSKAVMTIVNMKQFRVDARVDETDVSRVAVGQTAVITVDALSDQRMTARVAFVGAVPVVQQGVVNYPVTLELDPTQAPVRPGMTANAAIEVTRRENVLLVPNRAVRTQGRNRVVEVMVNGKPESRTVTVGMSNDQFTELLDGLQEGDLVVIPGTTTAAPRGIPGAGGFAAPAGGPSMGSGGMFIAK